MCSAAPSHPAGLKDQAPTAVSSLLGVLKNDTDPTVRASAAFALSSIRQAFVKAGLSSNKSSESDPIKQETLFAAFDAALEQDALNRLALIDAIEHLGQLPNAATPGLIDALKDPSIVIRGKAVAALSHFTSGVDPAIPVLMHDLETNASRFPPDYFEAAKEMRPSPAVVPILIKSLESDNWMVREAAQLFLSQVGPEAASSRPRLGRRHQKDDLESGDHSDARWRVRPTPSGRRWPVSTTRPTEPRRGTVDIAPSFTKALVRVAPLPEGGSLNSSLRS